MRHNLHTLNNEDLIAAYGDLIALFKRRNITRTKNIVGDIGEFLTIAYYNSHAQLPQLTPAPANTTNFDATDAEGNRYSIKSTTVNRTGAFHLGEEIDINASTVGHFDFALVTILSESYQIKTIKCFTWQQFLAEKKWSTRQKAWFLPLTKESVGRARTIYPEA
jgi:hypothetical protein